MTKRTGQFSIRTLLVVTLVVAIGLPAFISSCSALVAYFSAKPDNTALITALTRRIPSVSAREIILRPDGETEIEVIWPEIAPQQLPANK